MTAGRDQKGSRGFPALALALWLLVGAAPVFGQPPEPSSPSGEGVLGDALAIAPGWSTAAATPPATTGLREEPRNALLAAWRTPLASLERRVESTRRAALEVGVWDLDAAAQALVQGSAGGTPVERARAAVELAPHLPAAHLALARALWLDEGSPMDAVRAVVEGLAAIAGHTEASLWFAGSGLYLLSLALIGGGLLVIVGAALLAFPHAAHDISHAVPGRPAECARSALLGAVLLVPVALGEGALGLALVATAAAVVYGTRRRRIALGFALAVLFAGLYPAPRWAGAFLDAFPGDPVAQAAYSTGHGMASPIDITRLEAAGDDPLALRGLAIHARQQGHLGRADALYQKLMRVDGSDVAVLNNAANVRLDLGHLDAALDLYERALAVERSPVVLFNLAQAYGQSFQVDDLNRTLEAAQRGDGELIAQLAALQRTRNEGFLVDLPLPVRTAWTRVLALPPGDGLAAELRAPIAPGRLGASDRFAAGAFAGVFALSFLVGSALKTSRWCARCGERQCRRCGTTIVREVCEACTRLFDHPERTDRALRVQRIEELQERERRLLRLATLASVLLPGAAGLLSDRPMRGLLASICFALVAACLLFRRGVVPDPLIAGWAAPVALLGTAAIAALLYVACVATSLVRAEKQS